ncbi:MFS transporter [Novosphingobium pentaromativorans]|uniref:Major facilitator superfamily MFS_1 n=1 Tax=Novosphingobium pentaromativorans US6-1 TaxID=1088721 RepID=G6EFV0_9SPHN|nr:MFS transporter [Novosphingobium pentaromativorans]EHJ59640.1 major facilitator superfamily MFS_1 [Novosphingobium pentaromativorans US6-1]
MDATSHPTGQQAQDTESWPPARQAWTAAFLLMAAYTLAFVDRQALALLVQPIKEDLGASDTAMSLLYGLSFTIFYVIVGVPVAWLADRSNRRNIIAVSIFVWSLATAACGLVRSYSGLFMARVAVGTGEGGLSPAAYSMLADCFPKERLAVAMGIYNMGVYFGGAGALILGGLIAAQVPPGSEIVVPILGTMKGWHIIFLLLGLPGALLSFAMLLVREPRRRGTGAGMPVTHARLGEIFAQLGRHARAYFGIIIGFSLMILVGNGTGAWIPAFLERSYGMSISEIGASYGWMVFFCGTTGALSGGFCASWLQRRGFVNGNLLAAVIGFSVLIPLTVGFPLMPTAGLALAGIGGMNFFAGFNFGGGLAALQELTPNGMRAQVSVIYMLSINLIGSTLGPTAVAMVTDFVFADPSRLGESISLVCAVASPLALVLLLIGMSGLRAARAERAGGELA